MIRNIFDFQCREPDFCSDLLVRAGMAEPERSGTENEMSRTDGWFRLSCESAENNSAQGGDDNEVHIADAR
jgi:hypothetical protein